MKKILIVDPGDFLGGAELFAIDIANNLSVNREVHLVTKGMSDYSEKLMNGVHLHRCSIPKLKIWNPLAFFRLIRAILKLHRLVKKISPAIILTNSIRAHIVGSIVSLIAKIPCVWFLHDYTFPVILARILAGIPKKIVCVSNHVKKSLTEKMSRNITKKIVIIPNGIDLEKVQMEIKKKPKIVLKKLLKIEENGKIIGIVGRIDRWKGQLEFIKAARELLLLRQNYHFVIIGNSNSHDEETTAYKSEIENFVKKHSLGFQVHFLGQQNEIYSLIAQMDLLVHASIEPEPFGRVIIEGMAVGTPVLASEMGGPKEIIDDGSDGYFWNGRDFRDLARKIEKIINSEELEILKRKAEEKIRNNFSMDKIMEKINYLLF